MLIQPIKTVIVDDYNDFKDKFKFSDNNEAGENGTDEELIDDYLKNIPNEKWFVSYVYAGNGFFVLNLFEQTIIVE